VVNLSLMAAVVADGGGDDCRWRMVLAPGLLVASWLMVGWPGDRMVGDGMAGDG
jgi:hypothetical protein